MSKAIVLLRVSSSGQTRRAGADEGYSVEVQRRGCYEKARQLEADVFQQFVAPAESASKGIYKTLREILDLITERGDISYLIVYKLDRFARDEEANFRALAELRAANCHLVSVTENFDDTPEGQFMLSISAGLAALESRRTAKRVLDGLVQKARSGGTPKRAPLGYLNVKKWEGANDIRYVEIDPERAPYIHWAFTVYATGEYTLNDLVEELYERGLRTRATSKNPEGKLGRSALARILKDPYYIGTVRYRGVDYDGSHPTFIDPETFQKVQQVLEGHHHAGEKHWRHTHHLKGTVFCGYCGSRLQFVQAVGRGGVPYRYFVCSERHLRQDCEAPYLREEAVEEAVERYYATSVRIDAERLAGIEAHLAQAFGTVSDYRKKQLDSEQRLVARLESERRRLLDALVAGVVPNDLFAEKQDELASKIASARVRLDAAKRSSEAAQDALA